VPPPPTLTAGEIDILVEIFQQLVAAETGENRADVDSALVAAVLRKDRKATAEFVARYSDCVYRYVRGRLSPRLDLVDDTVQDIFLAAWEHLSTYRGTSPLQDWLLGVARHKVEDYYRSVLRQPELLSDFNQAELHGEDESEIETSLDRKRLQEKAQRGF
jgi:RNA polymerase sigma-70 factor (ECF subfamily)